MYSEECIQILATKRCSFVIMEPASKTHSACHDLPTSMLNMDSEMLASTTCAADSQR